MPLSADTKAKPQIPAPSGIGRQSFGYLVHNLARQLRRRFEAGARHQDLTMPQWRLLAQLAHQDGLSQVALASLIETDPMTLSGLAERLEARGLVQRETDPADSRAKIVKIAPKARVLVVEMKAVAEAVYAEVFDGISEAERRTTLSVLARVNDNLITNSVPSKEELA